MFFAAPALVIDDVRPWRALQRSTNMFISKLPYIALWILFGFTGLPLIILASVYAYRAIRNKKFLRILLFPLIDLIRTLAFCLGQMYQILIKN